MDSAGTNKELNKYVAVIFLVIVAAAYIVNAMDGFYRSHQASRLR